MNGVKKGSINYKRKTYDYTVYYMPLSPKVVNEVIHFFGNRFREGKRCLEVDEKYIQDNILYNDSIAYIKVHERGYDDYATASLKLSNWCSENSSTEEVFVMALCRSGNQKSKYSPVNILFKLSEQIAHKLKKKHIYLFAQKGEGQSRLIEIYKNYGFEPIHCLRIPSEFSLRKKINFSDIVSKKHRKKNIVTKKKTRNHIFHDSSHL